MMEMIISTTEKIMSACGNNLPRRKDDDIHDANHHHGRGQNALGRQEDALCPADRAVRETINAYGSRFRNQN